VAVYFRAGLNGARVNGYAEDYDDLEVLRFRYLYVGTRRRAPSSRKVGAMAMMTYKKGFEDGLVQGQQKAIRTLLEHKFGPLSLAVVVRLRALPPERLEELLLTVYKASSLKETGLEDGGRES